MTRPSVSPIEFQTPTLPLNFGSVRSCVTVVTGPVSSSFQAIPSIPENQGRVYSRFGSKGGLACASMRFAKFGMRSLSSFSAQPCEMYSPSGRSLSVETMMSRPIPCPWLRRPWIVAKYSELELMSS